MRQQAETNAGEVPLEHKEEFIYCVNDHALEQISQRGCGSCFPGDIQELSGRSPVPRALGRAWLTTMVPPNLTHSDSVLL